jgi:hypothetical protein
MPQAKRPLIPLNKFPQHIQKFISEDSPLAVTKLIVQGLVPVSGAIKICALYQAAHLHEALYQKSSSTLSQLPAEEISESIKTLPPPIIDWVSESCQRSPDCAMAVLAHPHTATSTLMRLLSTAEERVASYLADNHVKLMSDVVLLQSLCLNPALPKSVKEKLIELAKYQGVDTSWLPIQNADSQTLQSNPQVTQTKNKIDHTSSSMTQSQRLDTEELPKQAVTISVNPKAKSPLSLVGEEGRAPSPQTISRKPLSLDLFPQQVQKFLAPDAPAQVLKLVLGGLFPMPTEMRVSALYHLSVTRREVTDQCIEAVRGISTQNLVDSSQVLQSAQTLDWLADICLGAEAHPKYKPLDDEAELVSALVTNTHVAEVTIARLALYTSKVGCERIALNEQRLLSQPSIIHALYYNPQFSTVHADRILELAAREGLDLTWLPDAQEVINEISGVNTPETDDLLQEAIQAGQNEDPKNAAINAVLQEHAARRAAESPEADKGKPKKGYALIQSLNVAQKIRLALLGSQGDRALLVKDSNKVVSRAAIRSPAVSVSEALLYARNHSLNASIIEYIAKNRKWMQNYRLKVQIILNPKTPVNISLNALNTLRPAELRSVSQSHNVSGVVSQKAKDLIKKRQG